MTSKINGLDTQQVATSPGARVRRTEARTGKPDADAAPATGDLHITGTARAMATLEQAVRDLPAVDDLRVAAATDALHAGTYAVDPQRIADRMLHLELELTNVMSPGRPTSR